MSIELNTQQIYASYEMEQWWHSSTKQVFEISGAAGTGKTTLVRYLIHKLGLDLTDVLFVAYMGKATMQLKRNGLPAKTIHSTCYTFEKVVARDEDGKMIILPNGRPKMTFEFVLKDNLPPHIKLIVVDEAGMVSEKYAKDLLSFGLPVVVLGDLNQLDPPFGKSFFLKNPDVILTELMRQSENDPIVWLAQRVLQNKPLPIGVYGKSAVITKKDLNEFTMKSADIILTSTNKLRHNVNTIFREKFEKYTDLNFPHVGEKVICRKNNYNKVIDDNISLVNGLSGIVEYVDKSSFDGKKLCMDFRPDFLDTKLFKNLYIDYNYLNRPPSSELEMDYSTLFLDKFEYAYAITTHLSQGSQWDNVLVLAEQNAFSPEVTKKILYTAITRASKQVTISI